MHGSNRLMPQRLSQKRGYSVQTHGLPKPWMATELPPLASRFADKSETQPKRVSSLVRSIHLKALSTL
jgi:hypothetical protein